MRSVKRVYLASRVWRFAWVIGLPARCVSDGQKGALVKIKGYDAGFSTTLQADWDLSLRLAAQGARGAVLPEAIVYRSNTSSHMAERTCKGNLVREVVQKHRRLFDRHYTQVALGHEKLRRKLQSYIEAGANSHVPNQLQPATLDWGDLRRLQPVSSVWGIDRGQPLDRYYIERFLNRHRKDIRGTGP